jgi:transposase
VRTVEPNRSQVTITWGVAEDTLPAEHPARVLWAITSRLDLSRFLVGAKAVQGHAGRPTLSPQVKLVLWLYAVSQGIGSAREIERRTRCETAFRWIVGERTVCHDTLSTFRAQQGGAFDQLLSDVLGTLVHQGVLSLELVALDGMRVRAAASAPSFRSAAALQECREQAALHVKAVLAQGDDPERSRAQKAARQAAARDFQRRIDEAIATVEKITQQPDPPLRPRASTTDAEARVMKMADGGFRPAYNVQLATAGSAMGGPRTIVGLRVTNVGSDMSSVPPLLDDIERRTGKRPNAILADANHASHAGIREATGRGVQAIIAVPERSQKVGRHSDTDDAINAWRERMTTDEAQRIYRARASLCELSNAHFRRRGLQQFLVRGLGNVGNVVLMVALATNLLQHAPALLA